MTPQPTIQPRRRPRSPRFQSRRRRPRRWLLGITVGVLLAIVVAVELYVALQPVPAPLSLPPGPSAPPVGMLAGSWAPAGGSRAGFRIPETVLLASNDVVGRTAALTGTARLTRTQITHIAMRVDLRAITINGKRQPGFATSLDTAQHPTASFTLAQPITLPTGLASGSVVHLTAVGQLTLRGIPRPVSITLAARRSGHSIQLAGSLPITLAGWHIKPPSGDGPLGSLADHGTAEFLIVLHKLQ